MRSMGGGGSATESSRDAGDRSEQRGLVVLGNQGRSCFRLFVGLSGPHLEGLFDHPVGEGIEVGGQGALQLLEFRPEGFVHEGTAQAGHHGGAALAAVAVGMDAVAAQQGHKQVARPLVGQGEAELDRRLLSLQLPEAGLDAFAGPLRRLPFSFAAGPSVQGLDAAQLFNQLLLRAGRRSTTLAGVAGIGGTGSVEASGCGTAAAADGDLRGGNQRQL